jgi:hypothetical protein
VAFWARYESWEGSNATVPVVVFIGDDGNTDGRVGPKAKATQLEGNGVHMRLSATIYIFKVIFK